VNWPPGIAHEINTPTQYVGDNVRFLGDAFEGVLQCIDKVTALIAQYPESVPSASLREQVRSSDMPYLREEIPKAIGQSLEGIQRIAKIVGAMKEFSHPGQDRTPTDINHAIANTITVATNEWKYVATVEVDLDSSLPMVPVVPGEFNQVILNIIVNAAHAIADTRASDATRMGTISVATRRLANGPRFGSLMTAAGCPVTCRIVFLIHSSLQKLLARDWPRSVDCS
jgi:signal transduction histidine kinase